MSAQAESPALAKRSREEIQSAVRDATFELAEAVPFKDLTIDQIARAAGISRTAFYFYFRSKHDLLRSAMEEVSDEAFREADRWWHGEGAPRTLIRAAIEGVVAVYLSHANLMRVGQEVAMYDEDMHELWQRLIGRFVTATAEHVRGEQVAGRLRPLEPEATAEALVWMVERCLYVFVGLRRRSAEQMVETLTDVWFHALYPDAG